MIPAYMRLVVAGALVLTLSAPFGPSAADAPWQTHQDQMCGVELKYPPSYSLEASGARDACALWITIGVREARRLRALFSLEIREIETADRAEAATTPLTLGGRFHGDRLLAYAHPTSPDTRLRAGATSFPLVIFYGAPIKPVTFNALLNGDNITGRFTPEPGGSQVVRIPLGPGLNTLVLSVEGSTASGQTVTDTHRLVFRVE